MTDLANQSASILMWFDLPFWEIVIKSTLAIALAALTCQLLRRHSAALRHRVWVIGLSRGTARAVRVALITPASGPCAAARRTNLQDDAGHAANNSNPRREHVLA